MTNYRLPDETRRHIYYAIAHVAIVSIYLEAALTLSPPDAFEILKDALLQLDHARHRIDGTTRDVHVQVQPLTRQEIP